MRVRFYLPLFLFSVFLTACSGLGSGLPGDRLVTGPLFSVSPEPQAPPDRFYILNKVLGDSVSENILSCFDLNDHRLRWEFSIDTEETPTAYNTSLLVGDARVILVVEGRAFALDPDTGALQWQGGIGGSLAFNNQASLRLVGEGLFFLNDAGHLLALDAASGEPLWTLRLEATELAIRRLYVSDGHLVVADWLDGETREQAALLVVDPATGEILHSLATRCPDGEGFFPDEPFRLYDSFLVAEEAHQAVFLIDHIRQVCVSLWSLQDGEILYLSLLPQDFELPFFYPEKTTLVTDVGVFIGEEVDRSGTPCRLVQVDPAGEVAVIAQLPNCSVLDPILWADPLLFALVVPEEGPLSVVAIPPSASQVAWTLPLDTPGTDWDEEGVAVFLREGRLVILETYLQENVRRLAYREIDPKTGAVLTGEAVTPRGETPWEVFPVPSPGGLYYLSENSLVWYSFEAGEEEVIWPAFYLK